MASDGDDEQIKVDLSIIDANATEICIVVTIHEMQKVESKTLSKFVILY
jgi:stress response protein SCP2